MSTLRRGAAICIGIAISMFVTACGGSSGGSTPPPPPTTYVLTVSSTNPASGVAIGVSPADNNGATNGTTSFTRTYNSGTTVTLTAPATSGGNSFSSWTGCTRSSGATCTVAMNASTTVTANYTTSVPTAYVLTVNSTNPASGLAIGVSPADNNGATNGTTSFTRTYNSGATVTLTAPATSGSNTFTSWTGCTSSSGATCTVAMNAGTTVTANYAVPVTYVLTVGSTNPVSGVAITVSPADNNGATNGSTSFARTYNSGTTVTLTAPATSGSNTFSSWSGCTTASTVTCTVTMSANTTVTANYATIYTLTVNSTNPASGVTIDYNNPLNSVIIPGTTSFTVTEPAGTELILTAPATVGSNTFGSWTGCTTATTVTCTVTLNSNMTVAANYTLPPLITPTVTVTPAASSIAVAQSLGVTVAVSGGSGNPTPTGSVTLSSGTYTSAAATLSGGSAQITIPANSLAVGSDTLTAAYTPDAASSSTYNKATGTAGVTIQTAVTVNLSSTGPAVTDQILGMNLAAWYDVVGNATAVNAAFAQAGIQAIRWPGGSWSDEYHWQTPNNSFNPNLPFMCENNSSGVPNGSTSWGGYSTFAQFVTSIVQGGNYDLALTADYGTDAACTGPGVPTEAAAWVAAALADGITVSHMTVGNEEYGSWETDLHSTPHDPTIYAAAVAGTNGYYALIKAANSSTLVGVVVDEDNTTGGWDNTVLANAKGSYDFVEYHYYPETPGSESDSFLVNQAAQNLTANINTIRAELVKWGTPNTPIYVGEIGGPYSNPGKQSWSITQGLYAGQVLGEMMNDGVSRLTWWIGFGNCNGQAGNDSTSIYGWQDFGAYNVFSDGPSDTTCLGAGPIGTMSPTARAFQLFSNVAVNGESVLTAAVAGDTTDVRAYAATHSGGTALVLFNLNETASEPVTVALSGGKTSSSGVTVETYDKAIYDLSGSPTGTPPDPAGTSTWAPPTTTSLGAPNLPLSLTLAPWSMNVVIIQ